MARRRSGLARLDRNESVFGVSAEVLAAWERQRTADVRKYGLNRYPDFFHTDLLNALARHHGLTPQNYTVLSDPGEAGNVLAAALLRGGELVQAWPINDVLSRPARAWGAKVRRVALDRGHGQDLAAIAAAVGPRTRLVHVQNPHDPAGRSFGQADLERLVAEVADRNEQTYVLVDESYAPYTSRGDFPDAVALIARDPGGSRLVVSRTFATAAGMAGDPVGYLISSQALAQQTEGVTTGFFVPGAYGWTNMDTNVDRMGERAMLALLTPEGDRHLAAVRERTLRGRRRLEGIVRAQRLEAVPSDASFVLVRGRGRYRDRGLAVALRRNGVRVRTPRGWGRRYAGFVRISVGTDDDLDRLEAALRAVYGEKKGTGTFLSRRASESATAGALGAGLASLQPPAARRQPPEHARVEAALTRRDLLRRAALGSAGAAVLLGALARPAGAFPPDSFYDTFNLARMIYHENPVGPSPAALEAVRAVIRGGPEAYGRYQESDVPDLVDAILRYNRPRSRFARRLTRRHVMLLHGSAEGLMLTADALVAGGTLVSEWPTYRIIRERVWQAGGKVVDVPLNGNTWRPDYPALAQALRDHPETGLVHFNVQNNPVGTVLQRGEFDDFAEYVFRNHPKVTILADESDHEFMDPGRAARMPDFFRYVARGKRLIHLQTFSHGFGLTGLRVGYLFAPPAVLRELRGKRTPRPVTAFGRAAALASLRDAPRQLSRSYKTVEDGRRYLYGELDRMGLRHLPSQGHYVMLDTGRDGDAVWSGLIALGILTRAGSEWDMQSWIRVCPGLPDENERFIAGLKTVLGAPDAGKPPTVPVPLPLPGGRRTRALREQLEASLARTRFVAARTGPPRAPYRVTPAAALTR